MKFYVDVDGTVIDSSARGEFNTDDPQRWYETSGKDVPKPKVMQQIFDIMVEDEPLLRPDLTFLTVRPSSLRHQTYESLKELPLSTWAFNIAMRPDRAKTITAADFKVAYLAERHRADDVFYLFDDLDEVVQAVKNRFPRARVYKVTGELVEEYRGPKWRPTAKDMAEMGCAGYTADTGVIRQFATGATRDTAKDKLDYEGFLSPRVLERYAQYMHKNRLQSDGTLRDSDNWQKGIPMDVYMKSAWRHFHAWWTAHRAGEPCEEHITALLFNAMGYLHEETKDD